MSDPRTSKLADILINYSTKVQPGDWVIVSGNSVALPLAREVVEKAVQAGGYVSTNITDDTIQETSLRFANEDQLKWVSPLNDLVTKQAKVSIYLDAPSNTRSMSGIDPKKQQMRAAAHQELSKIQMERSATKDLRWVITNYPCPAYAQEADMSLRDYEDFVYQATFADQDDPVAAWQKIHDEQQEKVYWLAGKKSVVVKGPDVDLSLSIDGRTFINADGENNMPSGEIFTSPVEDSANGWIKFTYPAIMSGREMEGVELEFKDGKVVTAKAEKNEDFLLAMLDTDENARFLGEFAIGTNYGITKFTKSILFDEKLGGTMHLAVGAGFPESGSKNQSSIHMDMICDMRKDSEITIDGELFYKDGEFQV
jgi:aminopeptidase